MKLYTLSGSIDEDTKKFIIEAVKKLGDKEVNVINSKTLKEVTGEVK